MHLKATQNPVGLQTPLMLTASVPWLESLLFLAALPRYNPQSLASGGKGGS